MKSFVKGFVLVMMVVVAASCCRSNVVSLNGEWTIAQVNGRQSVGETTPFIGFNPQDSTMYGNSSCNRFFGSIRYTVGDAHALSFDNVGSTRMLCHNSPMEQEILAALGSVVSFAYTSSGDVELLGKDDSVLLLLTPMNDEK